ncbi:hypothetical protein FNH22_00320 [Fulvivirga sp. M361]|uniref:hypothetical protein n=1 Tax=Fulvivirga sp. M361 TaxID=2594266 RepID=UPI0011798D85|nr:hypothetical protein [Fulvivirga sp. M361]TRX62575.1 hypothetical protein FNH22_00320 [Fulvivirga sp. M361]
MEKRGKDMVVTKEGLLCDNHFLNFPISGIVDTGYHIEEDFETINPLFLTSFNERLVCIKMLDGRRHFETLILN